MWTDQLLQVILKDCLSASVLTGIYAINTLPIRVQYPAGLIVNLSVSGTQGTHWVVIYINNIRHGFYFDSLGRPPPKPIEKFLKRNCVLYHFNNIKFQDDLSVYCGQFCIVFLYFAVRGINILSKFDTNNLRKNDTIVLKYVKQIRKQNKKCK
jgi:hypothetical protein